MDFSSQKLLVVVDGTETDPAVVEAGIERVETEGGSLVVLHVLPERTYEGRRRGASRPGPLAVDGYTYTLDQAVESATNLAERIARETIGDRDVPAEFVGGPGRRDRTIRSIAAAYGCSTVFLAENRSWLGRVLGRNRGLTRGFDGWVVRVPRTGPVLPEPAVLTEPAR